MSSHARSSRIFRRQVGERLRHFRTMLSLSQEDIALAADVTQGSISNYENGRSEIPLSVLLAICEALEVRPVDLIPDLARPAVAHAS